MGFALGVDRVGVLAHPDAPVPGTAAAAFEGFVSRRERGEPVAYIRGFREFHGQAIATDPRALIPRPETELLVDEAITAVVNRLTAAPRTEGAPPLRVADVGTGSGAIAVALIAALRRRRMDEHVMVTAVDISPEALDLARENAAGHGVADRMRFREGDLLTIGDTPYAVICANLPYVATGALDGLATDLSFEPRAGPRRRRGRAGRNPPVAGAAAQGSRGRRGRPVRDRLRPGGFRSRRGGRAAARLAVCCAGRPGRPAAARAHRAATPPRDRARRRDGARRRVGSPVKDHRPRTRPEPAFPIRMLALDIDGTLVGHDMQLSDRLVAAIGEAVRRGVKVSLATGRMPTSAVVFANRLGLEEPIIGHQGAIVRAMPAPSARIEVGPPPARGRIGRILSHQPMAPDVIADAVRWCFANGLNPHINTIERMIVQEGDPNFADYSAYLGREAETVSDLATDIRTPMSKVIAVGEPGRPMALIEEARRRFAGRASPTVSHPRFLEFVAPGVSKGRAVAWLAHRAGIPMGQVLAMGDALNDVEMIVDAGHGAAMATAPAEVQLAARYIAAPVDLDGAAALVEALVLAPPEEAARNAARLANEARAIQATLAAGTAA